MWRSVACRASCHHLYFGYRVPLGALKWVPIHPLLRGTFIICLTVYILSLSCSLVLYCIVLYCIVLMGWSLLPNALRPFRDVLCSPEFKCRLIFAQRPILSGLRFFNEPEISDSGPLKKNPSTSAGFEPANLGSRGEHVTPNPPRRFRVYLLVTCEMWSIRKDSKVYRTIEILVSWQGI